MEHNQRSRREFFTVFGIAIPAIFGIGKIIEEAGECRAPTNNTTPPAEPLTQFTYDGERNETTRYDYDRGSRTTYHYDLAGKLIMKTSDG